VFGCCAEPRVAGIWRRLNGPTHCASTGRARPGPGPGPLRGLGSVSVPYGLVRRSLAHVRAYRSPMLRAPASPAYTLHTPLSSRVCCVILLPRALNTAHAPASSPEPDRLSPAAAALPGRRSEPVSVETPRLQSAPFCVSCLSSPSPVNTPSPHPKAANPAGPSPQEYLTRFAQLA